MCLLNISSTLLPSKLVMYFQPSLVVKSYDCTRSRYLLSEHSACTIRSSALFYLCNRFKSAHQFVSISSPSSTNFLQIKRARDRPNYSRSISNSNIKPFHRELWFAKKKAKSKKSGTNQTNSNRHHLPQRCAVVISGVLLYKRTCPVQTSALSNTFSHSYS